MNPKNMNKNNGFSGVLKGGFSLFTTLALVLNIASPAVAIADAPQYVMDTPTIQTTGTMQISISGSASATHYVGQMSDQFVTIDWGDGQKDADISIASDTRFTTTSDKDNFSTSWTPIPHTYYTAGTKTILIKVHHSNFNGKEGDQSEFTTDVVISPSTASLTVTNVIVGGPSSQSDFNLMVGITPVVSGVSTDFPINSSAQVYVLNPPADYSLAYSGDCAPFGFINFVTAGQHYDCTLTNTYGTTTSTSTNSAPTIALNGSSTIDIIQGTTFVDPGASATDTEDGDLTSSIVTTGSVDASTTGTYILTYTVTDTGGLSASTTRTVNVNASVPQTFQLTVSTSGEGSGTVTSGDNKINCVSGSEEACTAAYNDGDQVTLTATAGDGSTFTDTWSGACTGNNPVCTVTMNSAQSANAHFSLSSTTTATTTTTTTTTGGSGSSIPGGHRHSSGSTGGQVLGISIGPDGFLECSDPYLTEYLHIGNKNNPEQVKKLQQFLNAYLQIDLPVTGTFGQMTYDAVMKFQSMNEAAILAPWGNAGLPTGPTGYVYKTTKRWINILKCPTLISTTPVPTLP